MFTNILSGALIFIGLFIPGWILSNLLERVFSERFTPIERVSASILLSSVLIVVPMTVFGYLQIPVLWQYSVLYQGLTLAGLTLLVVLERKRIPKYLSRLRAHLGSGLFFWTILAISAGLLLHVLMHPVQDWDAVQLYLLDAMAIVRTNMIPAISPINNTPIVFPPFTSIIYAWATLGSGTLISGNWYYQLRFLPLPFILGTAALLYHCSKQWGLSGNARQIALILFSMSPLLLIHFDFFLYYSDLYFMFFAFGSVAWFISSLKEGTGSHNLAFFLSGVSTGMSSLTKPHGVFMPLMWMMTCFLVTGKLTRFIVFSVANLLFIVAPLLTGVPEPQTEFLTSVTLLAFCVPFLYRMPTIKISHNWKILAVTAVFAIGGYIWPLRNLLLFKSFFGEQILTTYGSSDIAWANALLLKIGVFAIPDGEALFGSWASYAIFIDILFLPSFLLYRAIGLYRSRSLGGMSLLIVWAFSYIVMWTLDVRHFSYRQLLPLLPIIVALDALGMVALLSRFFSDKISFRLLFSFTGLTLLLNLPFIAGATRDFPSLLPYFGPISLYFYYASGLVPLIFAYMMSVTALLVFLAWRLRNKISTMTPRRIRAVGRVTSRVFLVVILLILIASPAAVIYRFGSFDAYALAIRNSFYLSELQVVQTVLQNSPSSTTLLAFGIWGVELYAQHQSLDMSRVYYLAQLRTIFSSRNATYVLERLHALNLTAAVFPDSRNLPFFQSFWSLKYDFDSFFTLLLDNPSVFQRQLSGAWQSYKLLSLTEFSGFVNVLLKDGNVTLGSAFTSEYQPNPTFSINGSLTFVADFSGLLLSLPTAGRSLGIAMAANVTYLACQLGGLQCRAVSSTVMNETVTGFSGFYSLPAGALLSQFSKTVAAQEYELQVNSVSATLMVSGAPNYSLVTHPVTTYIFQWFPQNSSGTLNPRSSNWTY